MLLKYSPILLILSYTIFLVPWKSNLGLLYYRSEKLQTELQQYVEYNTAVDEQNRNYIKILLPKSRRQKSKLDTLMVRFTKNEFSIISELDYDAPKFAWNVGYVEYQPNGYWIPLIPNHGKHESFIIPLTLSKGHIPTGEHSIFLTLLPPDLRIGRTGEMARVLD